MSRLIDIVGNVFGSLTVIERGENMDGKPAYLCQCSCGNTKLIRGKTLRNGTSQSCGCGIGKWKHGYKNHPLYNTWKGIRQRCLNENCAFYYNYGGRGITLQENWQDTPHEFIQYIEKSQGTKPSSAHTLDRIDNDAGYYEGNLRWSDKKKQSVNRRNTVPANDIEAFNRMSQEGLSINEIAKSTGWSGRTVRNHLNKQ